MWELTSLNEHYYCIFIKVCCVVNILVCVIPENGRWPSKRVQGTKKLLIEVYCTCICLFVLKNGNEILLQ